MESKKLIEELFEEVDVDVKGGTSDTQCHVWYMLGFPCFGSGLPYCKLWQANCDPDQK